MEIQQNSESGAAIVLSLFLVSALLFFIIAFVNDTYQYKTARAEADALALQMCATGSRYLPSVPLAIEKMNAMLELNQPANPSRELVRVHYIAPGARLDAGAAGAPPTVLYNEEPLSNLLSTDTCSSLLPDGACQFSNDVDLVSDRYPGSLWTRDNYGAFIGCEVSIRVRSLTLEQELVHGKASFHLRDPRDDLGQSSSPGVLIGIAPQLTTAALEPTSTGVLVPSRFTFDDPTLSDFDPLFGFAPGSNPVSGNIGFGFPRMGSSIPEISGKSFPNSLGTSGGNRRDMLVNAMNPYLGVRNALISALMERFADVHWSRSSVELALISPQNEGTTTPNYPTKVIPFGEDITLRAYKYPFMNFIPTPLTGAGSGGASDAKAKRQSLTSMGYMCPFASDSDCSFAPLAGAGKDAADQYHQYQVTAQLRHGFHLYYDNGTTRGIRGIPDASYAHNEQYNFEPIEMRADDYISDYNAAMPRWEQSDAQDLNGVELVRSLGAFEVCPGSIGVGNPSICTKPPLFPANISADATGLKPDLLAFLEYASESGSDVSKQAYLYPGNIPTTNLASSYIPPRAAIPDEFVNSHVVLFFSKRITTAERDQIQALVQARFVNRPITAVFIPTNAGDASGTVLGRFQQAFQTVTTSNELIVLRPNCGFTPELQCYRNYWQDLLDTETAPSIWDVADSIYRSRFAVSKLAF